MSEQNMRRVVVNLLRAAGLDPISVENPAYPGTPDVNFVDGWVELKHSQRWPIKDGTPLRLPHFTPQQRVWLLRRWRAGGNVWLMLQVGQDWLLFDGQTASAEVGGRCREDLFKFARIHWKGTPESEKLKLALTRKS